MIYKDDFLQQLSSYFEKVRQVYLAKMSWTESEISILTTFTNKIIIQSY